MKSSDEKELLASNNKMFTPYANTNQHKSGQNTNQNDNHQTELSFKNT